MSATYSAARANSRNASIHDSEGLMPYPFTGLFRKSQRRFRSLRHNRRTEVYQLHALLKAEIRTDSNVSVGLSILQQLFEPPITSFSQRLRHGPHSALL